MKEIDYSFGGNLKSFTAILGIKHVDIIIGNFKKGQGLKKHYHKAPTEEVYYILEGEVMVTVNDEIITAEVGDMLSIPPNTIHWPLNHKNEVCKILFILSPKEKGGPVIVE